MFIIDAKGGLGNQMYQYALYRSLQEQGREAYLSLLHYERAQQNPHTHIVAHGRRFLLEDICNVKVECPEIKDVFRLGSVKNDFFSKVLRKLGMYKATHIREEADGYPSLEQLLSYDKAFLDGYWQDFAYSASIETKLREELTFKEPLEGKNREIADEMTTCNAVSIHVRLNDYLSVPMYQIQPKEYFTRAVEYISERVENPVFYCFSDDMDWCREAFKDKNVTFVDWNTGADSYRDMQLMSLCRHNIVTNSTFSIWAAWLNAHPDKIVVRPAHYFSEGHREHEFAWPPEWIIK